MAEVVMQMQGEKGLEAGFYLAGRASDKLCIIDSLCVPKQKAWSVLEGCALTIPGSEITRLGKLVDASGRQFCGQMHSHPDDAFHSEPDDSAPAMRFDGALSIVSPRFGTTGAMPDDAAVFRFDVGFPGWVQLTGKKLKKIRVVETETFEVLGIE